jgi:hypothetical protein
MKPRATIPEHVLELRTMNHGVMQNELSETIVRAIWEGKAIMGTDDGSVRDPVVPTYSFVIFISRTDVKTSVKGGGFLPPTDCTVSRSVLETSQSRGGPLLAGLTWIHELLQQYPNHTGTDPHPLLIPVDNDGVVKDVHRIINAQTPTYDLATQSRF